MIFKAMRFGTERRQLQDFGTDEVFDLGYLTEVFSFQAFSQTGMSFIVSRIFFKFGTVNAVQYLGPAVR